MNKFFNRITLFFLAISLAACGGGGSNGSGGSEPQFLGGIYSGSVSLTGNTCPIVVPLTNSVQYTVNQDDKRIVLEASPSKATYVGSPLLKDSFVASAIIESDKCKTETAIIMSDIQSTKAKVEVIIETRCQLTRCAVDYTGVLDRKMK